MVLAVAEEAADAPRDGGLGLAAVEDRDGVAVPGELVDEREPVEAGAAHDKDVHRACSLEWVSVAAAARYHGISRVLKKGWRGDRGASGRRVG